MYPVEYEVRETSTYTAWFAHLRDSRAKLRIVERIRRLERGERQGRAAVLILLNGGDKSTQRHDLKTARRIARQV